MVEARRWYNKFLELDPDNPEALHQLAALGERAAPSRAANDYVVSHFDRFADNFDKNLVQELNYVGPQRLDELISGALGPDAPLGAVLDLGCGTGLSGLPFKGRFTRLDGVDLSKEMIAKARKRMLYNRLDVVEVTAYLARAKRRYDLVLAADVLIYFGDVAPVFAGAARVLNPGGYFACANEWQRKPGYSLTPSGRYAHGHDEFRKAAAAAGLEEIAVRNDRLRDEFGKPVKGTFWLFRRP
jgi:predicted TPR repeat methyltransferase